MADYVSLDILTPDGRIDLRLVEGGKPGSEKGPIEVEGVELPAALGEMGVRPRHIPFLTPVVPGVVRFRYSGGDRRLAVGAGFLEISEDGVVTILTERALRSWEVAVDEVRAELDELSKEIGSEKGSIDDPNTLKLLARRDWLDAQLRAAQG
jgi:F-type H+-transporting ATPase subunit epsilon